ncbi:MAG: hypothetical protein IT332_02885 [Ardenticatenales bacterium]|nr:hypothetical protein [Ardenticatenales bacterium]
MPDVVGFQPNTLYLEIHHGDHAARLLEHGIIEEDSVDAYEQAAISFLSRPVDGNGITLEGRRENGDRIRWNRDTREFGVVCKCGFVHTYYVIDDDRRPPEYKDDEDYFYGATGEGLKERKCCRTRRTT